MLPIAKVFTTGNSQAVRLPKAFRVDVQEMWIAKNEVTGEITLKPKADVKQRKRELEILLKALADNRLPDDFLAESTRRNRPLGAPRSPFGEGTLS